MRGKISRTETGCQAQRVDLFSSTELVDMAHFTPVRQHERRLKADFLLVQNIRSLLAARGVDAKALAMWAGHRPAWLSKILSGDRGIKLSDLDKIADFFGLTVAQLFQHGISALTERRRAERRRDIDRRSGKDRRGTGHADQGVAPFRKKGMPMRTKDDEEVA
jgi:transcriptional regulator with XRE-family HTH domain